MPGTACPITSRREADERRRRTRTMRRNSLPVAFGMPIWHSRAMLKRFALPGLVLSVLATGAHAGDAKPPVTTFSGSVSLLRQYGAGAADSSWRLNLSLN